MFGDSLMRITLEQDDMGKTYLVVSNNHTPQSQILLHESYVRFHEAPAEEIKLAFGAVNDFLQTLTPSESLRFLKFYTDTNDRIAYAADRRAGILMILHEIMLDFEMIRREIDLFDKLRIYVLTSPFCEQIDEPDATHRKDMRDRIYLKSYHVIDLLEITFICKLFFPIWNMIRMQLFSPLEEDPEILLASILLTALKTSRYAPAIMQLEALIAVRGRVYWQHVDEKTTDGAWIVLHANLKVLSNLFVIQQVNYDITAENDITKWLISCIKAFHGLLSCSQSTESKK